MNLSLALFHRLPPGMRNWLSSIRGNGLKAWRYGPETPGLIEAAIGRETWSASEWKHYSNRRLQEMLEWAAHEIPYYKKYWSEGAGAGSSEGWKELRNWPVLRKAELRKNGEMFVHPALKSGCRREATSGSTGTPLSLYLTRESSREWYSLMEARWRGWVGVSRLDCWAILGGQLVAPIHQTKPPFWVENRSMNQIYMSSYHISKDTWRDYMEVLRAKRVSHIIGYASSLHSLAVLAGDARWEFPDLKCILSNAEPLYQHQRELIARVFGCVVRDTYGMSEMVCAASECEAGKMHLWPEVGHIEVLEDDSDALVEDGRVGRLVCTGFLNRAMPLIRYEIGDRGSLSAQGNRCSCGRSLPILASLEGRMDDVLWSADGRRIGRLDPVFKTGVPVLEAQVVQESIRRLRVVVVPDKGYGPSTEARLAASFRERLGEVEVEFSQVEKIPRGANGKFKTVVCRLSSEELKSLGGKS
jgi:phenylacetate-CoA ligase